MSGPSTIEQNLAFLREAAEDGARLTMPGVPYYILWGAVSAVANGLVYLALTGRLDVEPWAIWAVSGTAALAVMAGLIWRDERNPDSRKLLNRVVGYVWGTTGGATFILAVGVGSAGAPELIGPVIATCIGIPFIVVGSIAGPRWLTWPGIGWWAASATQFALAGQPETVLVMAGSGIVFMVLPGLVLLRHTAGRMI